MTKRLVYLPDSTIRFYTYHTCSIDREENEMCTEEEKLAWSCDEIEFTILVPENNIFNVLLKKFKDKYYCHPYFDNLLEHIELYEVIDV